MKSALVVLIIVTMKNFCNEYIDPMYFNRSYCCIVIVEGEHLPGHPSEVLEATVRGLKYSLVLKITHFVNILNTIKSYGIVFSLVKYYL